VVVVDLVTLLAVEHSARQTPHCYTENHQERGSWSLEIELDPLQDTRRMRENPRNVRLTAGPDIHCQTRRVRQQLQPL
jgi:hypothetical protein